MQCEAPNCSKPAIMKRTLMIDRTHNALCSACFVRIYTGFSNHAAAWEKIEDPEPSPASKPDQNSNQPTLF